MVSAAAAGGSHCARSSVSQVGHQFFLCVDQDPDPARIAVEDVTSGLHVGRQGMEVKPSCIDPAKCFGKPETDECGLYVVEVEDDLLLDHGRKRWIGL